MVKTLGILGVDAVTVTSHDDSAPTVMANAVLRHLTFSSDAFDANTWQNFLQNRDQARSVMLGELTSMHTQWMPSIGISHLVLRLIFSVWLAGRAVAAEKANPRARIFQTALLRVSSP